MAYGLANPREDGQHYSAVGGSLGAQTLDMCLRLVARADQREAGGPKIATVPLRASPIPEPFRIQKRKAYSQAHSTYHLLAEAWRHPSASGSPSRP